MDDQNLNDTIILENEQKEITIEEKDGDINIVEIRVVTKEIKKRK